MRLLLIYNWQIPATVDDSRLLIDITKTTSIRDDLPEEAKKNSEKIWDNGKWVPSMYDNENVNYIQAVENPLESSGLNPEDYTYEFVNGLPGIRYPVAVVFSEQNAEFVIPVQKATTHAFPENSEDMTYTASPSIATNSRNNSGENTFSVYRF